MTPGEVVLQHFHAPDDNHRSWWINTDEMTAALTPLLAQAWDAGYEARSEDRHTGIEEYGAWYYDETPNPYRTEDK